MSSGHLSWNRNQTGLLHSATCCGMIEQDVQAMLPLDVLVIEGSKNQVAASLSLRRKPDLWLSLAGAATVHACLLLSLLAAPYLIPSQAPSWPEVVPVSLYTAGELELEAPPVQPTGLRAAPPRPAAPVARRARNNIPAVQATTSPSQSVAAEGAGAPSTASPPPAPAQQEGATTLPAPVSNEGFDKVGAVAVAVTGSEARDVPAQPRYRENRSPHYPEQARRRWLEGTVVLEALVGGEGKVGDLAVHASSGHQLLDEAALQAVRLWLFEPGRRAGLPVTMKVLVPVRFALR